MEEQSALEAPATIGLWTPVELASRIAAGRIGRNHNGAILADAAARFHAETGVRNEYTDELIASLKDPATIVVRLAHQANLFPYVQIGAQTVFLSALRDALLARNHDTVPIIFLVDHDVAGKKWMKLAQLVDLKVASQVRSLILPLSKGDQRTPACHVAAPSDEARARLGASLVEYCRGRKVPSDYLLDAIGLYRPAKTFADFNAFGWAKLALEIWRLPLLFVRLSDLAGILDEDREALVRLVSERGNKPRDTLLWAMCPHCRQRVPLTSQCCGQPIANAPTLPRVLIDELSDYALFGVDGGTTYASGRTHVVDAHNMAARIGMPVPDESCWRLDATLLPPADNFHLVTSPKARDMTASGRGSLVEHLVSAAAADALKIALLKLMQTSAALRGS